MSGPWRSGQNMDSTEDLDPKTAAGLEELQWQSRMMELQQQEEDNQHMMLLLDRTAVELEEDIKKVKASHFDRDMFLKARGATRARAKVKQDKKQATRLEKEIQKLKAEYDKLTEKEVEQQRHIQRHAGLRDFLEQVTARTGYDSVATLMSHVDDLLYWRNAYHGMVEQRGREVQQSRDPQEEQSEQLVQSLKRDLQLTDVRAELEQVLRKEEESEKRWDDALHTLNDDALELVQIKMAAYNLYNLLEERERLPMEDTLGQLDKISYHLQHRQEVLKQYHVSEREKKKKKQQVKSYAGRGKNR